MPRIEVVVRRFFGFWKSRHAFIFAQSAKAPDAPGENLMHIGLMPHVKDQLVSRKIEDVMQGQR